MSDNLNITSNDNVTIVDGVEYVQCAHCGQLVPADSLHDVYVFGDNDYYDVEEWCDECVDSDATRCERCGELVDRTVEVRVGSIGRIDDWCPECVNEHAAECEHCGILYDRDDLSTVIINQYWSRPDDTEEWCSDCVDADADECSDCGELFAHSCDEFHEERTWDGDYIWICNNCRDDNNWRWCDDCGRLVSDRDYHYSDEDDCIYCPDCWEEHRCDALMGYHHTCGNSFWQDNGSSVNSWDLCGEKASRRLYLGVELETDYNDSAVDLARDVMSEFTTDMIECKHDGSLYEEGVEFVSQPGTPLWQLTSGMWERVIEIVRDHGGKSHDAGTCGLHIHGSRAFFNDHDAVYRLDRLFHRFRSEMINFSRRTPSQLGEWCRLGGEHDELVKIDSISQRKREWQKIKGYSRYECVNDTNSATVEVRLWRGTLNPQTLRATIEFTTGLFLVANTMTDEYADELTWPMLKSLVRYALQAEGIPCDDLDAYLKLRNL